MRKVETRELTIGAMIVVMSLMTLFLSNVFVNLRLSVLLASSFLIAVSLIEIGVYGASLVYAASALLGILLVPNKVLILSYTALFGVYPIVKHILEKKKLLVREYIFKLAFFNLTLIFGYSFYSIFIPKNSFLFLPAWMAAAIAQVLFIVYDLALSFSITYYLNEIRPKLKF